MKILEIYRFELYYQLRRPSTWVYFVAILGLIFLVLDELVEYTTRTGSEMLLNSPIAVAVITGYANKFGLLLIAALAGDAAMRDIQARMDPLLYTTSVSKFSYLCGRFFSIFSISSLLVLVVVPVSELLARFALGMEPSLFGNFSSQAYINSGLFFTFPNVLVATALLYSVVLLYRHAMAAYVAGFVLFLFSTSALDFANGNWVLGKLIDPTGLTVVDELRRSLPPFRINTELVRLNRSLLTNRAFWISISLGVGLVAYFRFRLFHSSRVPRRKKVVTTNADVSPRVRRAPVSLFAVPRSFYFYSRLYQTRALALRYFREIVFTPSGLIIPAVATYAFLLIPNLAQGPLSVPGLPTTDRITTLMNSSALEMIVVMFITLMAGQAVWGERDARLNEISDAVPVPTGVLIVSRYLGIVLVLVTVQAAVMAAGVAIQLVAGYHQLEIGQYLQVLFGLQFVDYLLFAAVALALHILINQKYVGHTAVLLFYLYTVIAPRLGIEHKLLIFGSDPGLSPSLFYGQGPFLLPWILFKLYWIGWALLLMVIAKQMWVRGREAGFQYRWQKAVNGLIRSPVLAGALVVVVSTGSLIFYHTNVSNEYDSVGERVEQQIAYERRYSQYKGVPQPHLTSTSLQIEFYPDQKEALVQGMYGLKNSSGQRIDSVHLALAPDVETDGIHFNRPTRAVLTDRKLRHLIYSLDQPLQPGDSLQLFFKVRYKSQGFSNGGIRTSVLSNGTYFNNRHWLPAIGYQAGRELDNDKQRRDHGLPKHRELPSPQDAAAVWDRFGQERIRFEATIGTAAGQTAIAPGSLRKTWTKDGRKYFQYGMDSPMRNIYHIHSASYAVRRSRWKGVDLLIFHHPRNRLNLKNIEQGMKASLEYYSANFGPYPYPQLKFVEYPDPGTGGVSLAGTVGYSTNFALLDTESDSRGFSLPFAVTAHEVAHQWWAHQLIPAEVKGAPLLTESLAWYSALGVVEQVHGSEHLQKLLDAMRAEYLNPRSRASLPLLQAVDGFQAYRKGPFAMYALREYIGEKRVNEALLNLMNKFKSGEPPYATSLDFYKELQAVTPDSMHYLLKDLFETNTFWELKTKEVHSAQLAAGRWQVTLDMLARKVRVDQAGTETEVLMDDPIEIGVYGRGKAGFQNCFYLKRHRIRSGVNRLVLEVTGKPEEAGIDPRHLLIDTETFNNVRKLAGP